MKLKKYILLTLIFIIIGCQEKEPIVCDLIINNGIAYTKGAEDDKTGYATGKIFSGDCFINRDGSIWKMLTYKRGLVTKEVSYYTPNGGLEYIGHRKNGAIHGKFTRYYRNGNIDIEGEIENGYYEGKWNYFNEEGTLIKEYFFEKGTAIDSLIY